MVTRLTTPDPSNPAETRVSFPASTSVQKTRPLTLSKTNTNHVGQVGGDREVLHAVDLQPPHLRLGGEEQQWLPHGGDTGAVLHGVALHAGAGEAAHRVLADLAAKPKYLTLINIQAATLVCSYLVPRLTVAGGAGGGVDAPVGAGGGGAGGSTWRDFFVPFSYSPC